MRNNKQTYEEWYDKHAVLTIDRESHKKLQELSKKDFRSMTAEVRFLINQYLQQQQQEQKQMVIVPK